MFEYVIAIMYLQFKDEHNSHISNIVLGETTLLLEACLEGLCEIIT